MLVELKNGETLNGHLVNCDTWMNLTLKEVVQTSPVRIFSPPQARMSYLHYLMICRMGTNSSGYPRSMFGETMLARLGITLVFPIADGPSDQIPSRAG